MSDFEMKYKGSELQALVEGSASALFYAGTIGAAYSIPGTNGAQVTVSQAFRTKYNIGENKEVFYIVDKRMIAGDDSNAVYIYPSDYEGCYFVMGDFEGNDAIFGLGATKGDWLVVQGSEWVKIATQQREIAGISGNVTTEALAQKLSTPTPTNADPLVKQSVLKDYAKENNEYKVVIKTQDNSLPFSNEYINSSGDWISSGNYATYKFSTESLIKIQASLKGDAGDCVLAFYTSDAISSSTFISASSVVLSSSVKGDIDLDTIPSNAKLVALSFKVKVYPDCTFRLTYKEPRVYDLLRSLAFIENDANGNITWADGSSGVLTANYNEDALAVEAFVATHTNSGYQVEQPTISYNEDFEIVSRPNLKISKI